MVYIFYSLEKTIRGKICHVICFIKDRMKVVSHYECWLLFSILFNSTDCTAHWDCLPWTQKIWKFRMECCGFTSRNLYVCVKTFLSFLHQFDRAFVSQGRCIGLCLLCSIWHHINQIQLLTYKSVDFFVIVWLCSGEEMVSILHEDLSHQLPVFNFRYVWNC